MNQFIKATGLERPFASLAMVAVIVSGVYAFFKLILICINSQASSFLSVFTSLLEMIISVTVSLLTIVFLLVAIQYLARRH